MNKLLTSLLLLLTFFYLPAQDIDINATSINLSEKSLGLVPAKLYEAKQLESLKLVHCELYLLDLCPNAKPEKTDSSVLIFSQLKQLKKLDLSFNPLLCIDKLPVLPNLEELNVSLSKIRRLPEQMASFTKLKTLNVYTSSLDTLPADFGNLTQLAYLDLRGTNCKSLPASFGNLKKLKYLDLNSMNYLKNIPSTFSGLTALETLSMQLLPKLEKFPEAIYSLTQLKSLALSQEDVVRWKLSVEELKKKLPLCEIIIN